MIRACIARRPRHDQVVVSTEVAARFCSLVEDFVLLDSDLECNTEMLQEQASSSERVVAEICTTTSGCTNNTSEDLHMAV